MNRFAYQIPVRGPENDSTITLRAMIATAEAFFFPILSNVLRTTGTLLLKVHPPWLVIFWLRVELPCVSTDDCRIPAVSVGVSRWLDWFKNLSRTIDKDKLIVP